MTRDQIVEVLKHKASWIIDRKCACSAQTIDAMLAAVKLLEERAEMSFADELKEMSSQPVSIVLEELKDLLRQKAETGAKACCIESHKIEFKPVTLLEEAFEILRQEGVEVEVEYGDRPGDLNYVTFRWA